MSMRVFGYKVLCELLFDIVKTKKSDLHIRFICSVCDCPYPVSFWSNALKNELSYWYFVSFENDMFHTMETWFLNFNFTCIFQILSLLKNDYVLISLYQKDWTVYNSETLIKQTSFCPSGNVWLQEH